MPGFAVDTVKKLYISLILDNRKKIGTTLNLFWI